MSPIEIGTVKQVHAYGVIALSYNRLEDFLIYHIAAYFPPPEAREAERHEDEPAMVCVRMLNNRQRLDFLKTLVFYNEKDNLISQRVIDAIDVFEICAENRNILAHGRRDSYDFDIDIFTIRKLASGSAYREVFFDIPLLELRNVANDMVMALNYFFDLNAFLIKHRLGLDDFEIDGRSDPYRPTLPEKPQIPRKLTPRPP
ncbi:hypothetical protein [Methylorubrum sp. POS3]|uniref:hypothetical protein n=1 Tax=Methylorubrum sp. POS3 TaxID=2998492 RepID=UPI0037283A62